MSPQATGEKHPGGRRVRASLAVDPSELFESRFSKDLARKSVRGGLAIMSAQGIGVLLQMISTIVLARLLTPDDFGLIAMVAVIVNFAQMFRDAGLGTATVQKDEITRAQISTLFWINVGVLVVLGGLVSASAPLVARFFHRPQLTAVTAVLGLAFILNGLSVQHEALLRRHMKFTGLAFSQIVSQAASLVVTIVLALAGWRYWALVAGTMTVSVISTIVVFSLCRWMPARPRRGSGAKGMITFGSHMLGFNVVNYFSRNADNLLIGRVIGSVALGLYAKAYSIFLAPMTQIRTPIGNVAMPALSSLQNEPARFAAYFRRFLDVLALLTVVVAGYCILEPEFIVRVLLGSQWLGAAPILRLLAVAGLMQSVASTRGLVLASCGRSKNYLQLGIANAVVMVASFIAGLPFGVRGVAAAYAIANFVFFFPSVYWFSRGTPVRPVDFYRALGRPLAFGAAAGAAGFLVRWAMGSDRWPAHIVTLVAFFGVYAGLALLSKGVRENTRLVLRSMFRSDRSRKEPVVEEA